MSRWCCYQCSATENTCLCCRIYTRGTLPVFLCHGLWLLLMMCYDRFWSNTTSILVWTWQRNWCLAWPCGELVLSSIGHTWSNVTYLPATLLMKVSMITCGAHTFPLAKCATKSPIVLTATSACRWLSLLSSGSNWLLDNALLFEEVSACSDLHRFKIVAIVFIYLLLDNVGSGLLRLWCHQILFVLVYWYNLRSWSLLLVLLLLPLIIIILL